ncbi:hypothetical protein [Pseudonocardia sp. D17]|uniref:hypothetical protein n=1 Tax=Pseudonocardia sp. D17 TaxID=882661 RepID=UPI0030D2BA32
MDRWWQSFLRRFDLEHTLRLFKQTLGWTAPKIRTPAAADRWTWLIITAYTQLRLARPLAVDLRRPWERPAEPGRLTPARVRRGFRYLREKTTRPAAAPKPGAPGLASDRGWVKIRSRATAGGSAPLWRMSDAARDITVAPVTNLLDLCRRSGLQP